MSDTPMSAVQAMSKFVNAYAAAARPVMTAVARQISALYEALRPMIEYYQQHPEELEAMRRERDAEEGYRGCHCLCGLHRDRPEVVCTGEAVPGLTVTRSSSTVGAVHIPMCRPCYSAAVAVG